MSDPADQQRMIGDLVQFGTVASVDLAHATCRVSLGEITTADLPWLTARAGALRIWSPPSVGEQCIVLSAEADLAAGVVLLGLFSDARPAPDTTDATVLIFDDGTLLRYDPEAHALDAILCADGIATIDAPGGIRLVGDVSIEGAVTATGEIASDADVLAGGIRLKTHKHPGVAAGAAQTGQPL